MDKSDMCMMLGSTLVMAALIMWETFGMMITPTVLTVAAGGCFVAAGLCAAREEENSGTGRGDYEKQGRGRC